MNVKNSFITSVLVLLATNSAVASLNPCLSLFASPTKAELVLSLEERISLLYSRLLVQYRMTVSEEEYLNFIETALKDQSYYTIRPTATSQFEMKSVFERIREMRTKGFLLSGEGLSGEEIDKNIREKLHAELKIFRRVSARVEKSVEEATVGTQPIQVIRAKSDARNDLQVNADFTRVVSPMMDGTLVVWDLGSAQEVMRLVGHPSSVFSFQVSSDFKRVLSGSFDKSLILWDLENGTEIRRFIGNKNQVRMVRASSDFKQAMSGTVTGRLKVWDLETRKVITELIGQQKTNNTYQVNCQFYSAN